MKILLAVDGSKHALAAILKCCEIVAISEETEIKIVSVANISSSIGVEPYVTSSEFHLSINKEIKKMAETFVADAKFTVIEKLGDKVKLETKILRGSPKVEIVEEAENWGADLIVVGSHGYGFFERMLIGSVSNAILHHAPCSVLVVKLREQSDD